MKLLAFMMPVGNSYMYIPDGNNGPSGPWTESDTKITLVILIITLAMALISVIIEKFRGFTFKEILSLNEKTTDKWLTAYTAFMMIAFYVIYGMTLIGYVGVQLYNIL